MKCSGYRRHVPHHRSEFQCIDVSARQLRKPDREQEMNVHARARQSLGSDGSDESPESDENEIAGASGYLIASSLSSPSSSPSRQSPATTDSDQDIRRRNEKLVISNEALAAANADLKTFSYSVAHDLRSPIRQIAGFSRILLEEYGPQLPTEARRYLIKVEQGVQQMDCLVDDLLHLAQVDRQALSLHVTSLDSIVVSALESLRPECAGRSIEWRLGSLCAVECDRGLMKQAFVNLLSNALKYTRPRTPAVIEVGQLKQNEEVVIFVRDNGVGFDMQYASKLFGVFQRLHPASEFEGTGIGLATVERIIRKHGGKIWAQAQPGHGATFFFTVLPLGQ